MHYKNQKLKNRTNNRGFNLIAENYSTIYENILQDKG